MKNETLERTWGKFLPHEATEENEKLGSSGNDVDQVIAILQRIPGCNDCDYDCDCDKIIEHILPAKLLYKISKTTVKK